MPDVAPPTEQDIDARLRGWGLEREEHSPLTPAASKNRTLICRQGAKRRVLVKVADGPANVGVVREGGILERLSPLTQDRRSPLRVPSLIAFDRELGLVVVEYVPDSETLHHYHRRTHRYTAMIGRQLGRALGWLHRVSQARPEVLRVEDRFREESDLLECFIRMRPNFYARLSQASIDFFAQVQAVAKVGAGLKLLSEQQASGGDGCLLHGDLKQANVLRVPKGHSHGLMLLDWELSFWGDPARDLGGILADYALCALVPERESEAIGQAELHRTFATLLVAYARERGSHFSMTRDFAERIVRWAGVALLFYVYGMTHYEGSFGGRARRIAVHAQDMVALPEHWPARLWGATP